MTSLDNPSQLNAFAQFPMERRERMKGWTGGVQHTFGYVWYPTDIDDIRNVLLLARSYGRTIALRGAGHSYTDAALNTEDIVVNLSHMRRILAWDSERGIIRVEPGVTVSQLWRATISNGWWLPVLPSVLEATLGGCLAMNVHGKNSWKKGSIGEHTLALEFLLASGELVTVTPSNNPDLFHAVIGGLGMLGVITSITLQLRPIHSGKLLTRRWSAHSLTDMLALFAEEAPTADYLEGWIDGSASTHRLGRGFVTRADFINEPDPVSLRPETQVLVPNIGKIISPVILGLAMRPLNNNIGIRVVNMMLNRSGTARRSGKIQRIPIAQFHFFHDSVFSYLNTLFPHGGHAIQSFVPLKYAPAVFTELLQRSQYAGLVPFRCILKQHRASPFLLSYQVDGFSLELDYGVTSHNAVRLPALLEELLEPVIGSGGRLYLAKDSVLNSQTYARSMGMDRIERFLAIKRTYDPEHIFQSDLFRRVFAQASL